MLWGVISDHLGDYCCRVGNLEFHHLDADFSTSGAGITGDKFKRHCSKSLFWREQLNGKKVKRERLCYSPSSKYFTALLANFFV